MQKRNIIILLLVLGVVIGFGIYQIKIKPSEVKPPVSEQKEEIAKEEPPVSEEKEEIAKEEEFIPSERAGKFYISGGESLPVFTREVIVDPFKVKEGEKQVFSIWAKDPQGVEKVTANIKTDIGEEIIELKLVEGTVEEGRWMSSWITKDISAKSSYSTVFQAKNKEDKVTQMTLSWQVER